MHLAHLIEQPLGVRRVEELPFRVCLGTSAIVRGQWREAGPPVAGRERQPAVEIALSQLCEPQRVDCNRQLLHAHHGKPLGGVQRGARARLDVENAHTESARDGSRLLLQPENEIVGPRIRLRCRFERDSEREDGNEQDCPSLRRRVVLSPPPLAQRRRRRGRAEEQEHGRLGGIPDHVGAVHHEVRERSAGHRHGATEVVAVEQEDRPLWIGAVLHAQRERIEGRSVRKIQRGRIDHPVGEVVREVRERQAADARELRGRHAARALDERPAQTERRPGVPVGRVV